MGAMAFWNRGVPTENTKIEKPRKPQNPKTPLSKTPLCGHEILGLSANPSAGRPVRRSIHRTVRWSLPRSFVRSVGPSVGPSSVGRSALRAIRRSAGQSLGPLAGLGGPLQPPQDAVKLIGGQASNEDEDTTMHKRSGPLG